MTSCRMARRGHAANAERGERAQAADFDTTYQQYLSSNSLSQTDPGVTVGAAAAAGIIALRESDGSFPVPPRPIFTGGTARGVWPPSPGVSADGGAVAGQRRPHSHRSHGLLSAIPFRRSMLGTCCTGKALPSAMSQKQMNALAAGQPVGRASGRPADEQKLVLRPASGFVCLSAAQPITTQASRVP